MTCQKKSDTSDKKLAKPHRRQSITMPNTESQQLRFSSVKIEETLYYRELLRSFMGLPFLICIRVCSQFDSVYTELTLIYSS